MIEVGSVVYSNKGHDDGRVYVVLKLDGEFAYVADGRIRTKTNPKKKRLKHLRDTFVKYKDSSKVDNLYDFEIATYLKNLDILHK